MNSKGKNRHLLGPVMFQPFHQVISLLSMSPTDSRGCATVKRSLHLARLSNRLRPTPSRCPMRQPALPLRADCSDSAVPSHQSRPNRRKLHPPSTPIPNSIAYWVSELDTYSGFHEPSRCGRSDRPLGLGRPTAKVRSPHIGLCSDVASCAR